VTCTAPYLAVTALAVALAGCRGRALDISRRQLLAVGWEGSFADSLLGPNGCEPAGGLLARSGDHWRAVRAGTASVPCKDGHVDVEVQPVSSLHIDAPAAMRLEEIADARVEARSASGQLLELGDDAPVEWTGAGAIEIRWTRGAKSDMDFIGPAIESLTMTPSATFLAAVHPGAGHVHVTWHDLAADADVTVSSP
jgi:hypothetical protein